LSALFAFALTGLAHSAPPPVEAFGRKPAMIGVDINPAGTRLAWIEDDGKAARIVIHDLATRSAIRTISTVFPTKLWDVKWASDETLLVNQSITRTVMRDRAYTIEWQRWIAVDASGGTNRMLLMIDETRENVSDAALVRVNTAFPGKVFMSTLDWLSTKYKEEVGSHLTTGRKDSGWVHNLYEVDLKSGNGRLIESGTQFTSDWLTDDTGRLLARADYNPKYNRFSVFVKDGRSWRTIYEVKDCKQLHLITFAADKKSVLALGRACGEDRGKIWSMPIDGTPMKPLFEDPTLEVSRTYTDPISGALLGVGLGGLEQPSRWLDAITEKRIGGLNRSLGMRNIHLVGRSADGQRVVVSAEDEAHPPTYYLVDYTAKKADILNEAYPLLANVTLGTVRHFNYEARDHYPLTAYLTLPANAVAKQLPVVVLPHGGPEARDHFGFDWLAQFLASRGYAVLQPQFRGSTGFGREHANAGRHQWGLRMQDDVSDGVQSLIAEEIADPRRICIVGWSYGGYAALAGAAFTPELYACAVSIAGVSDLPSMLGWDFSTSGGRESDSVDYWRDHIGAAGDPQVIAKSPSRAAKAVRAPVLLIHGIDDTVVPIAQSQRMARALESAGKPYELIELKNEDHWMMTSSASRIRMLTELERFLAKHIPPTPLPTAQATKN
jgi:dipeptidyl aminopeptidase/acylaminoacyl peptidase